MTQVSVPGSVDSVRIHKGFDFQNSHRANFFPTGPFDLKIGTELVLGIRYEIYAIPKIVT
jgi:hypothetical protein